MTITRGGIAQPSADPAVVDLLRAHEWDHRAKSCACGWSQRRSVPRGAERVNHPIHVAAMIAGGAPMTDSIAARFTVCMAPLNGAGVPLAGHGGGRFVIDAVSAAEAGRQVRAELAGIPIASGWMPWSVRDSDGEEVWHFTDGPLEEKR